MWKTKKIHPINNCLLCHNKCKNKLKDYNNNCKCNYNIHENCYHQIVNRFDNKCLICKEKLIEERIIIYCNNLQTNNYLVKITIEKNNIKICRITKFFKYEKEKRIKFYSYKNYLSLEDNITYSLFSYKKENLNIDTNNKYKILINQRKNEKYILFFVLGFILLII